MYLLIILATVGFITSAIGASMLQKTPVKGLQLIILGHVIMATTIVFKGLV